MIQWVQRVALLLCGIAGGLACETTSEPFDAAAVELAGSWDFTETNVGVLNGVRITCLWSTPMTLTPYPVDTTLQYLATFADSAHYECTSGARGSAPYFFAGQEYPVHHARDSVVISYGGGPLLFSGILRSSREMGGIGHVFEEQSWKATRPPALTTH
jgi:hypothetical protein